MYTYQRKYQNYHVYSLSDLAGNVRYIGVTHNVKKRFEAHLNRAKNGEIKPVYVWIRVQNYKVQCDVLHVLPKEEAYEKERYYVKSMKGLLNRDKHRRIQVNQPPPLFWRFRSFLREKSPPAATGTLSLVGRGTCTPTGRRHEPCTIQGVHIFFTCNRQ